MNHVQGTPNQNEPTDLGAHPVSLYLIIKKKLGGGGGKGGARPSSGEGGRGLHRNDFFPSHLLCTTKSQMGGGELEVHGVNGGGGGGMDPRHPHSYATGSITVPCPWAPRGSCYACGTFPTARSEM